MALLDAAARDRAGPREPAELRAAAAALADFAALAPNVERRDEALDAGTRRIPLRVYAPKDRACDELPGLVYFHGGGWVTGGLETHDALCATLAHLATCRVVAVDYRLAPESRFPAAHDDAAAAVSAVAARPELWEIDGRRLGVGGDSAGAGLAASAVRRASAAGLPLALQLLLCPVLDPIGRTASRRDLATGYLVDEATMARYWELYRIEGLAPDDPAVAPLAAADFSGLPPALIHTAEYDPLRDEGALYADSLERSGVSVRYTMHAGLIHHFYCLGGVIPAGAAALSEIGEELREAFAGKLG